MKVGDQFYAIILKGPRSKTYLGEEAAGRRFGPFEFKFIDIRRAVHATSKVFCEAVIGYKAGFVIVKRIFRESDFCIEVVK